MKSVKIDPDPMRPDYILVMDGGKTTLRAYSASSIATVGEWCIQRLKLPDDAENGKAQWAFDKKLNDAEAKKLFLSAEAFFVSAKFRHIKVPKGGHLPEPQAFDN